MDSKTFVLYLFLGLSIISLILIVVGFYRPWIVLWWEDVQHRKKVLKYYGNSAIVFYLIYWLIKLYW